MSDLLFYGLLYGGIIAAVCAAILQNPSPRGDGICYGCGGVIGVGRDWCDECLAKHLERDLQDTLATTMKRNRAGGRR